MYTGVRKGKRKEIYGVLGCSLILFFVLRGFDINILDSFPIDFKGFHIDLITINSIIAGFAFTNLGILISLVDMREVEELKKTDIMIKKNEKLITCIYFLCFSMIISLMYVLNIFHVFKEICIRICEPLNVIALALNQFFTIICYVSMIAGVIYFMASLREVNKLIRLIYANQSKLSADDVERITKAMKMNDNNDN